MKPLFLDYADQAPLLRPYRARQEQARRASRARAFRRRLRAWWQREALWLRTVALIVGPALAMLLAITVGVLLLVRLAG